jgi:hypothetical protein
MVAERSARVVTCPRSITRTSLTATSLKELSVHSPSGPVLDGGYVLHSETATGSAKLRAIRSYPVDADTWLVRAIDDSNGAGGVWELAVSVVCEI